MIKRTTSLALLISLLSFSCANQRVVLHETRQAKSSHKNQTAAPTKMTLPSGLVKAPTPVSPAPEPAPVAPKELLTPTQVKQLDPVSNLSELKKNIANPKIATDLIENKLTLQELESASADTSFSSLKPQLLLKAGKEYQKNQQLEQANTSYRTVVAMYPQSPYSVQAAVLLSALQNTGDADSKVIGAILPMTGKNANLGQHALNAIRMGLEMNKPDTKFRIAIYDSQGLPELAAKGVDKLIKEDHAIVILGGFTAKEATAIGERAELLSTPYMGFSQKSGLTNIGDYVFRNSVTPEMQVDKLVQFAVEKLGAKKFAVLYPNDYYGVEFSNIFWDHVLARGGEITAAQTYDPKETDFSEVIEKLVGTFYVEARSDEYHQRLREIKAGRVSKKGAPPAPKGSSRDHWSEENILPPITDFDVLFIPDSSRALGQILAFMKFNEVKDMKYIGTNLWNSPELPKRASDEQTGVYFVDAIDTSNEGSKNSSFLKDYMAQYNEEPTLVEIQVYEASHIIKEQLSSGASSRLSLANNLRSMGRSQGVTGELRMSSQRELERPLHILTLDAGIVKKME
jgi:branched-chain amino acid transport system substrate-binding protein